MSSTKGSSKSPNKSAASDEGSKGKKKSSKSSDDKSDKKSRTSESSSSSASSSSSEDPKYSHPPFKTLVSEAIFEDNAKKGTSKQMIIKFICANYNVDEDKCPKNVTKTIKKMEKNKELIRQPNSRKYKFHDKWKAIYCKETGRKAPKKKKKRSAAPKDPRMPKRPKTAWNYFSSKVRADLKKKHPTYDFGDISTKLSKRWNDCEDRSEWEALANKDKKRYQKEMKAYEKMIKEEKKKKDSSSDSSESESSSARRKRKEKEKKKRKEKEKKNKKMETSDDDDEEDKGKGKENEKGKENKEKENKEKENKEKENKENKDKEIKDNKQQKKVQ